jgi:WD40 repeat protein
LKQSFTDHSHVGCVRAAAVSSKGVLATGSSDETIKLFHLEKRRELGALMHHKGNGRMQLAFLPQQALLSLLNDFSQKSFYTFIPKHLISFGKPCTKASGVHFMFSNFSVSI